MGKKDKHAGKKGSEPSEDIKRDQKLQAIVLADSFMKTFRPITWEKPKAFNVPVILICFIFYYIFNRFYFRL